MLMAIFNIYISKKSEVLGASMEPTFYEGDNAYTSMLPYILSKPEIGDIIVIDIDMPEGAGFFHHFSQLIKRNAFVKLFSSEDEISTDTYWIKRIVGIAGDTLEFKNNKFYRNGEIVEEDYIKDQIVYTYPLDTKIVVPEGYIYVMGDNRNISKDSRDATVGAIPTYKIIGKVWKNSSN